MPPPPLLLDLDGTLIRSLPDIAASTNHLRAQFGLPAVAEAVVRRWVGDGLAALMRRALADTGPFEAIRDRAWAIYQDHHDQQCTRLVTSYPGVEAWLERWHRERRPLGVVTNKPERFAVRILRHLGLDRHLPVAVCGDTLPVVKPHPEPLREALRRLGGPPGRGTMAGDGVQDLRAGKAAGLRTVAALFGLGDPAALRAEGADEYWRAFGEVE